MALRATVLNTVVGRTESTKDPVGVPSGTPGHISALPELQTQAIEQSLCGDHICAAGHDHGILIFRGRSVAAYEDGHFHGLCGETYDVTF